MKPTNAISHADYIKVEKDFHDDYADRLDWNAPFDGRLSYNNFDVAAVFFRKRLGPVSGLRVLDVGSGHGNTALYLATEGASVTSIDISPKLIDGCKKRAAINNLNVDFFVMDANVLDFPDETFDIVVGFRTIHHLPDIFNFAKEAMRVLKTDGRLLLVEPQKWNPFVEFGRRFIKNKDIDRTVTEHPLVPKDLSVIKEVFGNIFTREYEFLVAPLSILKMIKMPSLYKLGALFVRPADSLLRLIPFLRPLYWQVFIECHKNSERNFLIEFDK